jgi:glycine hydroxymethyltransferase
LTGSAGETFSVPQSGIIVWNDHDLTERSRTPFSLYWPRLTKVNRVAALAVSAAEMLAFGEIYMAQIVSNARALARALSRRGLSVLGKSRSRGSSFEKRRADQARAEADERST